MVSARRLLAAALAAAFLAGSALHGWSHDGSQAHPCAACETLKAPLLDAPPAAPTAAPEPGGEVAPLFAARPRAARTSPRRDRAPPSAIS